MRDLEKTLRAHMQREGAEWKQRARRNGALDETGGRGPRARSFDQQLLDALRTTADWRTRAWVQAECGCTSRYLTRDGLMRLKRRGLVEYRRAPHDANVFEWRATDDAQD